MRPHGRTAVLAGRPRGRPVLVPPGVASLFCLGGAQPHNQMSHCQHTHLLSFLFKTSFYKRKVTAGLTHMKTEVTLSTRDSSDVFLTEGPSAFRCLLVSAERAAPAAWAAPTCGACAHPGSTRIDTFVKWPLLLRWRHFQ